MIFKCPSCGFDLSSFLKVWFTAPIKRFKCEKCGDSFKLKKTGRIKYTSYLIGLFVAALVILVLEKIVTPMLLLAILPILALDYFIDRKNWNLLNFISLSSNKPIE
jgi:hypothetical protein